MGISSIKLLSEQLKTIKLIQKRETIIFMNK